MNKSVVIRKLLIYILLVQIGLLALALIYILENHPVLSKIYGAILTMWFFHSIILSQTSIFKKEDAALKYLRFDILSIFKFFLNSRSLFPLVIGNMILADLLFIYIYGRKPTKN